MNTLEYRGFIIVRDSEKENLYWIKQSVDDTPFAHIWKLINGLCEGYIHDSCDPGFGGKDFYKIVDRIIDKKLNYCNTVKE